MLPIVQSLFPPAGESRPESIAPLVAGGRFQLEHIVSHGAGSPAGFWYDQDRPEWVALLRGQAVLEFAEGSLSLRAGDCLLIPAGLRHRVAGTSRDAVWLALHHDGREAAPPAF